MRRGALEDVRCSETRVKDERLVRMDMYNEGLGLGCLRMAKMQLSSWSQQNLQ